MTFQTKRDDLKLRSLDRDISNETWRSQVLRWWNCKRNLTISGPYFHFTCHNEPEIITFRLKGKITGPGWWQDHKLHQMLSVTHTHKCHKMSLPDCHVSCEMSLLMPHLATRNFVTCRVCNVLAHTPFLQEKGVRSDFPSLGPWCILPSLGWWLHHPNPICRCLSGPRTSTYLWLTEVSLAKSHMHSINYWEYVCPRARTAGPQKRPVVFLIWGPCCQNTIHSGLLIEVTHLKTDSNRASLLRGFFVSPWLKCLTVQKPMQVQTRNPQNQTKPSKKKQNKTTFQSFARSFLNANHNQQGQHLCLGPLKNAFGES